MCLSPQKKRVVYLKKRKGSKHALVNKTVWVYNAIVRKYNIVLASFS